MSWNLVQKVCAVEPCLCSPTYHAPTEREAIEARIQLLKSRRELLSEARESVEEAEDAEVAITDQVANER